MRQGHFDGRTDQRSHELSKKRGASRGIEISRLNIIGTGEGSTERSTILSVERALSEVTQVTKACASFTDTSTPAWLLDTRRPVSWQISAHRIIWKKCIARNSCKCFSIQCRNRLRWAPYEGLTPCHDLSDVPVIGAWVRSIDQVVLRFAKSFNGHLRITSMHIKPAGTGCRS